MINRRFHECMQRHKNDKEKMNKIIRMSDGELVHSVCRKERLTLFNFIKSHLNDQYLTQGSINFENNKSNSPQLSLNEERIKEIINSEYAFYFRPHVYVNG